MARPRIGRSVPVESAPLAITRAALAGFEQKDAPTRRASYGGYGSYTYNQQPYTPPGTNIDRLVREGYERVIWAFKAIDACAEKLSSTRIECLEGAGPDDVGKSVDDPILPLLNQYSNKIERSAKHFRYRLVSQLLLSKKGVFVEVLPTNGGGFSALNLLPPSYTSVLPDHDNFIGGFRVQLPGGTEDDAFIDLPVYDPKKRAGVVWIRKPHPTDPYSSVTPLEAAGISLDLDFYARMYNRNFLLNDGRAGQLVAVKGGLSDEDARELKARFQPGINGVGRTTVIEADSVSVQDTAVTPRDAQYAELRKITKEDLLIALGTPESVIGNASGRTFDNADAEKENWLDVTVLPLGDVVARGFDELTKGGYDDDRQLAHDWSKEPVLQRRENLAIDKARQDFNEGRISLDEWRDIASMDQLKRPGADVVWIPAGGKVAVGDEKDETAAAELKPVGTPPPPPDPGMLGMGGDPNAPGGGGDLTGFDSELNALGSDPSMAGALQQGKAYTELELKGFNPQQPRYPMGTPQGGQFMSLGDVALWLAGKPLSTGVSASQVVDPNQGSTAQASPTPGGGGGAARFLASPDPKVRAAAALISFPQGYPYARVLGAPPAQTLPNQSQVKLVSLRKGDVIRYGYSGGALPPGVVAGGIAATGDWTVASAARRSNGRIELTLVNADGEETRVTGPAAQTAGAVARTPHPTVVAQAKRDVTAAAKKLAAAGAGAAGAGAAGAAGMKFYIGDWVKDPQGNVGKVTAVQPVTGVVDVASTDPVTGRTVTSSWRPGQLTQAQAPAAPAVTHVVQPPAGGLAPTTTMVTPGAKLTSIPATFVAGAPAAPPAPQPSSGTQMMPPPSRGGLVMTIAASYMPVAQLQNGGLTSVVGKPFWTPQRATTAYGSGAVTNRMNAGAVYLDPSGSITITAADGSALHYPSSGGAEVLDPITAHQRYYAAQQAGQPWHDVTNATGLIHVQAAAAGGLTGATLHGFPLGPFPVYSVTGGQVYQHTNGDTLTVFPSGTGAVNGPGGRRRITQAAVRQALTQPPPVGRGTSWVLLPPGTKVVGKGQPPVLPGGVAAPFSAAPTGFSTGKALVPQSVSPFSAGWGPGTYVMNGQHAQTRPGLPELLVIDKNGDATIHSPTSAPLQIPAAQVPVMLNAPGWSFGSSVTTPPNASSGYLTVPAAAPGTKPTPASFLLWQGMQGVTLVGVTGGSPIGTQAQARQNFAASTLATNGAPGPGVHVSSRGDVLVVAQDMSAVYYPLGTTGAGGALAKVLDAQQSHALITTGRQAGVAWRVESSSAVSATGVPQAPAAPAVAPIMATPTGPTANPNFPRVSPGERVFIHPQGKAIYVDTSTGTLSVYKPGGQKGTTSATMAKLLAPGGFGQWQEATQFDGTGRPIDPFGNPPPGGAPAAAPAAPAPQPTWAAATPAPTPNVGAGATPQPTWATPVPQQPAAVQPPASSPPPPAAPPTVASSAAAQAVVAAGVPQLSIDTSLGWKVTGGAAGSNPGSFMTAPSGTRYYVKSQDAKHADNEVAAARLYAAAGVTVPTVARASINSGSFSGQSGTDGIASQIVAGTPDMSSRVSASLTYKNQLIGDFAVHAWLANWDAVENNNTITDAASGKPMPVDLGGSLLFRARGGHRKLTPNVTDVHSMQTSGGTSARTFKGVTPTDPAFVAGVERIAAISPADIQRIVRSSYPSLSAKQQGDLSTTLIARRADLAKQSGVTLPENRQPATPQASAVVPPAAPAPAAVAVATQQVVGAAPASSVLTFPVGYPYPIVTGAPVATALAAPKPIKVASLRKGDVVQDGGGGKSPVTVISVDRKSGDIVCLNSAGQRVTLYGSNHPTGSVLAVARTPHPQVVAAARRQQNAPAAAAAPAPAPAAAAPAAPVVQTVPAVAPGAAAGGAARNFGAPQNGGYAPVPGQTYAAPGGSVIAVHSDGSGTYYAPGSQGVSQTPTQVEGLLDTGTAYVPVGPNILTSTYSLRVGRHQNAAGDYVDIHADGSGTLVLAQAGSTPVPLNEAGVNQLLAGGANQFAWAGPSPALRGAQQAAIAAAATAAPSAPQSAPPNTPGYWRTQNQILPGAVFVLPSSGATLTIGPRGGGKMTVGGRTRNMSSAAAASALTKRNTKWQLQTPSPQAQVNAAAPAAAPAAAAAPANPLIPQWTTQVGRPATQFSKFLQPGQLFTNAKTGNTMLIDSTGQGNLVLGPRARGGTAGRKTPAMTARTLMAAGWVGTTGPDIDTPGPQFNAAVRKATRLAKAGKPAPGTPVPGNLPGSPVWPSAAVGPTTKVPRSSLARGQTVVLGGRSFIVTETDTAGNVWGYEPGVDNPLNMIEDTHGTWHQGHIVVPVGSGPSVDVVSPPAPVAGNVPVAGITGLVDANGVSYNVTPAARAYDPTLGSTAAATGIGTTNGAPFDFISQTVPSANLLPGDVILLNGREAEGSFVVTAVKPDYKGRPSVFGYAGTTADATGTAPTEHRLFILRPANNPQSRVQVHGAPAPVPSVPRPTPPTFGDSGIERNSISDPSSAAKVLSVINQGRYGLSTLPTLTTNSDLICGHLMELRGYNALPDVITEAELASYVNNDGEIELWRGISGGGATNDYAEDYRSGKHYTGGVSGTAYGIGSYFAYGQHGGNKDATVIAGSYAGGGQLIHATLKPDARIIEFDVIKRAFAADTSPAAQALRSQVGRGDTVLGHYAVLLGYDAIRKSRGFSNSLNKGSANVWDDGFLIVVNRSAVRVSEVTYGAARAGHKAPKSAAKVVKRNTTGPGAMHHDAGVDYSVHKEP